MIKNVLLILAVMTATSIQSGTAQTTGAVVPAIERLHFFFRSLNFDHGSETANARGTGYLLAQMRLDPKAAARLMAAASAYGATMGALRKEQVSAVARYAKPSERELAMRMLAERRDFVTVELYRKLIDDLGVADGDKVKEWLLSSASPRK